MLRVTVLKEFDAWDSSIEKPVNIEAGTVLQDCRIAFNRRFGPDPMPVRYVVEFALNGRRCHCPLHRFQARTQQGGPARWES